LQALLHPRDLRPRLSGSIRFLGQEAAAWDAWRIRELPLAVIPEDRQAEGLLLERPLSENFLLGLHRHEEFNRSGFLGVRKLADKTARGLAEYDVRPAHPALLAGRLSGGNQQKLILAREFYHDPAILIAAHPTRGVDVGAIEFIHKRIIRARDEGAGVLLISSELEEILALADRVLVMYEGRFVAQFHRGQATEYELGLKMGGS
jgi:ABC-type uncharacterized transport system ATPase subunit